MEGAIYALKPESTLESVLYPLAEVEISLIYSCLVLVEGHVGRIDRKRIYDVCVLRATKTLELPHARHCYVGPLTGLGIERGGTLGNIRSAEGIWGVVESPYSGQGLNEFGAF